MYVATEGVRPRLERGDLEIGRRRRSRDHLALRNRITRLRVDGDVVGHGLRVREVDRERGTALHIDRADVEGETVRGHIHRAVCDGRGALRGCRSTAAAGGGYERDTGGKDHDEKPGGWSMRFHGQILPPRAESG